MATEPAKSTAATWAAGELRDVVAPPPGKPSGSASGVGVAEVSHAPTLLGAAAELSTSTDAASSQAKPTGQSKDKAADPFMEPGKDPWISSSASTRVS